MRTAGRNRVSTGFLCFLATCLISTMLPTLGASVVHAEESHLLSLNRTAYASSQEGGLAPGLAVDGNAGSRWASEGGADPQWIYVDLGAQAVIDRVRIQWEAAYATAYQVQVSDDESTWTDVYVTASGDGGTDDLLVAGTGRYVRVLGTSRSIAGYGYSIYELEIYGTGGVNEPPVVLGPNVALNRPAAASTVEEAWYIEPGSNVAGSAVDGEMSTRWSSVHNDDQWIYVDLGSQRTIGRVILRWETAAGRAYDIQVSNDATNWTTVYRELEGDGDVDDIPLYTTGRYVRMKGIARLTSFGYSLFEFEVYDYVQGDPQPSYPIPGLPIPQTVPAGQGSYLTNDIHMPQPQLPKYRSSSLDVPLESNGWWQSLMIKELGDALVTLPLKSQYFPQGLGILNPGEGWINGDGSAVNASGAPDLYLMSSSIDASKMETRVADYGDWHMQAVLSDDATDKMKTTFVKGSPYVYSEFSNPNTVEIYSSVITRIFNDANQTILANNGDQIAADHIGIEIRNTDEGGNAETKYYGLFAPDGTTFTRVGSKIKLQLGGGQNYVSLAALSSSSDLGYFHQHAYAFVSDTNVSYDFNESTSEVTTVFQASTQLKRSGFTDQTLLTLYPHQWKITDSPLTSLSYSSIRGLLKVREGNTFTTVDRFYGIVPQFTEPTNPAYSEQELLGYLDWLEQDTASSLMAADAYWQGKKLHPLAMGVLIADELGEQAYRDTFLERMRIILEDWYTYTQGEPDYFFYYNDDWGTLYYKTSEFGANYGITDHHFTYGYFVFASAILATYDQQFLDEYGPMVEHLIRDYANPSRNDSLYPFFRSFDPYQGHSWAGGYADNNNGNNQEAAGESLFGWVGQYMWSLLTGDTAFRDAAIYGFTTELKAIEQYWFNYDQDNWRPEWTHKSVGQVYASSYFYGTFFSGDPESIYGIHWLPTAEWMTSYGFDPAKAASLYAGLVQDNGGPEDTWQHIIWPVQALSDPQAVIQKWNASVMQQNEVFNAYWFVHNLASLGHRTKDIWATGWSGATVYKNGSAYTALVWNPTDSPVTVTFRNAGGITGTAVVAAKSLVRVDPLTDSQVGDDGEPGDGEGEDGGNDGTTGTDLALHKPVTVSSVEGAFAGASAVDGDGGTRWASEHGTDPQWITVDLQNEYSIDRIKLSWEAAYAAAYQLQVSSDGSNWTDLYSTSAGDGGIDEIDVDGAGRYVRMLGTARATPYGYSLWSLEVYGEAESSTPSSLLSRGKAVTVSSVEGPFAGANAVDDDAGTRWGSELGADPQWIAIDLGGTHHVERIRLDWEEAYATAYQLQISNDGTTWTDLYSTTSGAGGIEELTVQGSGRYVRMLGTVRATPFGYSLWEFEVYGH